MPRAATLAAKRLIDVVGASLALVLLAPVLIAVASACAATQGLPILFRQDRPGLHGQVFVLLKFRTMRRPARGETVHLTDALRVTRFGRFLRATSLDELPELWNVLRGEMSLVGPRPLLVEYLDAYTREEGWRHDMRPGITSWAAVNGRHMSRFEDRLALDVWYVENWTLALDFRIMAMTAGQVIRRVDVSTTQDLLEIELPARFRERLDRAVAKRNGNERSP